MESTDPAEHPQTVEGRHEDDPILGEDGYPHESELRRIREWPWEGGFRSLMEYVRRRWAYADAGYWEQQGDRFSISTAGWSGNEDIIGALEQNQMFHVLCPVAWRRGGHYVYDVQEWSDGPEGKRVLIRDPATPMKDGFTVNPCDQCVEAAR
jgi:hypothetical protein